MLKIPTYLWKIIFKIKNYKLYILKLLLINLFLTIKKLYFKNFHLWI